MRHLLPLRYIDAVVRAGSIRKAAEALSITSTALNRRILTMERELGVPIFERLPRGVRLSTAGEILIQHVRTQLSDMERVKSQIADLSGVRRGHISIACSQALMPVFLPEQIALYRREHPAVTFRVLRRDREVAERRQRLVRDERVMIEAVVGVPAAPVLEHPHADGVPRETTVAEDQVVDEAHADDKELRHLLHLRH